MYGLFRHRRAEKTALIFDLAPVDNLLKPVDNVLRKRFTDPSGLGVVVEIPQKGINLKPGLTKFTPHSTVLSERRERQADHDFCFGWSDVIAEIALRLRHGCGG